MPPGTHFTHLAGGGANAERRSVRADEVTYTRPATHNSPARGIVNGVDVVIHEDLFLGGNGKKRANNRRRTAEASQRGAPHYMVDPATLSKRQRRQLRGWQRRDR